MGLAICERGGRVRVPDVDDLGAVHSIAESIYEGLKK